MSDYEGKDFAVTDRERADEVRAWVRENKATWLKAYRDFQLYKTGDRAWAVAVLNRSESPRARGVWNLGGRVKAVLDQLALGGWVCYVLLADPETDAFIDLSYPVALARARGPFPGRGEGSDPYWEIPEVEPLSSK